MRKCERLVSIMFFLFVFLLFCFFPTQCPWISVCNQYQLNSIKREGNKTRVSQIEWMSERMNEWMNAWVNVYFSHSANAAAFESWIEQVSNTHAPKESCLAAFAWQYRLNEVQQTWLKWWWGDSQFFLSTFIITRNFNCLTIAIFNQCSNNIQKQTQISTTWHSINVYFRCVHVFTFSSC